MRTDNLSSSPPAGLYIHIPFCQTKCPYCDFYSITDTALLPSFLQCLQREMELHADIFTCFDSIYIGGGTPSLLSIQQMDALLTKIHAIFHIATDAEITVEINPADWKGEELRALRHCGVNRLNIGVQSLVNEPLLGRRHSTADAINTIENALNANFKNIGADMIYGLPQQTLTQWRQSLTKILDFPLQHLSCYQLEVKAETPMGKLLAQGGLTLLPEEAQRDFFFLTADLLEASGYLHYEVSNFAQGANFASRHNQKYWEHLPYLGVGPAAHSFSQGRRWNNFAHVITYCQSVKEGQLPVEQQEVMDKQDLLREAIFLGIRTKKGIEVEALRRRHLVDILQERKALIKALEQAGLIVIHGTHLSPTRDGLAVADGIALLFDY
ncbi:MAG: radical SAM family heme chaperone HemW [Deltaproteobacteria bacterium]|nr:radical SAM family heme chaperone HemW [Deltaproteobacteria bacterium]